jgi:aarF domain-containing kinase
LDFGACRDFNKSFTDEYMRVIYFAAKQDKEGIIDASRKLKFLTGTSPPPPQIPAVTDPF